MRSNTILNAARTFCIICTCILPASAFSQSNATSRLSIPENSAFIKNIDSHKFQEATPPDNPVLFRWDFSENKEYIYDYEQKVATENEMSGFGPNSKNSITAQSTTGNGTLAYKSEKGKIARFVLENLTLKSTFENENIDKNAPKTMEMKSPPLIIQGVKEDGNLSIPSSAQTLLLKLLFPLPSEPMKKSDTVSTEVNMPFNAMGSLLLVKGHSKTTLEKYVEINGIKCAKLVSVIDISDLEIPPELKGKFVALAKGNSVFYFDIENRKFISGNLALLMAMDIETQSPEVKFSGENKQPEMLPSTIKMAMNSDNFISVTIIEK